MHIHMFYLTVGEKSKGQQAKTKKKGMCSMLPFVFKQFCKTTWNNMVLLPLEAFKRNCYQELSLGKGGGWVGERKEKNLFPPFHTFWIFYWYIYNKWRDRQIIKIKKKFFKSAYHTSLCGPWYKFSISKYTLTC